MAIQLMFYQLSANEATDLGLVRKNNEDYLKLLKEDQFFVLADGMGGHQAGEIASRVAVEEVCSLFQENQEYFYQSLVTAEQTLGELIREVNAIIFDMGKENPNYHGMGTTLCVLFFHSRGLIYGHVGDSRIYRFRKERLEQLTTDHSLLRELIDLGQLTDHEAENFLYKNIITRAIGTDPEVDPSIRHTTIEVGDMYLLCTDGLTDMVPFKQMEEILNQNSETDAVSALMDTAKKNGGFDNITIILVKVNGKNGPNLP